MALPKKTIKNKTNKINTHQHINKSNNTPTNNHKNTKITKPYKTNKETTTSDISHNTAKITTQTTRLTNPQTKHKVQHSHKIPIRNPKQLHNKKIEILHNIINPQLLKYTIKTIPFIYTKKTTKKTINLIRLQTKNKPGHLIIQTHNKVIWPHHTPTKINSHTQIHITTLAQNPQINKLQHKTNTHKSTTKLKKSQPTNKRKRKRKKKKQ